MDSHATERQPKVNAHLISPALTPTEDVFHDGTSEFPDLEDSTGDWGKGKGGRSQTLDPAKEPAFRVRSSLKETDDHYPRRLTLDTTPKKVDDPLSAGAVSKLSAARIQELTSAPESLPVRRLILEPSKRSKETPSSLRDEYSESGSKNHNGQDFSGVEERRIPNGVPAHNRDAMFENTTKPNSTAQQDYHVHRLSPSPALEKFEKISETHSDLRSKGHASGSPDLPIPPFSMPTYLHLELASERPSRLYIDSAADVLPYEPYRVKIERLLNFLRLPRQLEQVLLFGALSCLDAWLYTFTILPLRFCRALWILLVWMSANFWFEIWDLCAPVLHALFRLGSRRGRSSDVIGKAGSDSEIPIENGYSKDSESIENQARHKEVHSRTSSNISSLQAHHKADLIQGLLIVTSCAFLMHFDASKIYHSIRGQAAIKLYVIYNMLEVCDRLFSALGQDIVECLFSTDTLQRHPNGRSKVLRPLWLFCLALIYAVVHAGALFYQTITLNVAVNSYNNALLTLLMSNQFVEIKGAVFKKIEKENLFQLTCADVVERFELWLMLFIIAMRNIVEVGGLAAYSNDLDDTGRAANADMGNQTFPRSFSILPDAFRFLPSAFPYKVLVPFIIVIGAEMIVDWLKHAYINKFNAISPKVYGRFLDVLAKDYYSNAFRGQSMTRRLGLPIIPLACLFIRASLQTYHMFLAANVSPPLISTATSLSTEADATASPVIAQIDFIFRSALGRSSFGGGSSTSAWWQWSLDDALALLTMIVFFLAVYMLLLAFKLLLGMALLKYARDRYATIQHRDNEKVVHVESKRIGGWSAVEVGEERRKTIYDEDPNGLANIRRRDARNLEKSVDASSSGLDHVDRYRMISKRIW